MRPSAALVVLVGVSAAVSAGPAVQTGSIAGRVTYRGPVPPPTIVVEGGSTQHVLYVNSDGALQYAVAFIRDAPAAPDAGPMAAATLNQRSFIFEPQVLAVRVGTPIRFGNNDPANHNVRSNDPNPENRFSLFTGQGSAERHMLHSNPDARPVVVECDIHPWMRAWIYVFDHPYFSVTGTDGRFRIDNVPAGRHRLSVAQPAGALTREVVVDVRAGATTEVPIVLRPGTVRDELPRHPHTDAFFAQLDSWYRCLNCSAVSLRPDASFVALYRDTPAQ